MKKLITLLLLAVFAFSLTGCDGQELSEEEQFEAAMVYMENVENVTMEMTIETSMFGMDVEETFTAKIDGYFMAMEVLGEMEYLINYNGYDFELMDMGNGEFGAVYVPSEGDEEDFLGLPEIDELTFADFDKEDDYYVYNGDLEELGDFKMKIEDSKITEMIIEVSEEFEGMVMSMTMTVVFFDYGSTTITNKPQVPHFEEYAEIIVELYEAGYQVMFEGDQLFIFSSTFSCAFEPDWEHSVGGIELNPADNTVWTYDGVDEGFFPFDEYYNGLVTAAIPREDLELIDSLLDIWQD